MGVNPNDISYMCGQILEVRGKLEPWAVFWALGTYEDDKLIISSITDTQGVYDSFEILLKMESQEERATGFGIPRSDHSDAPLVFYKKKNFDFYRPGKWLLYLQDLHREIMEPINATKKLDHQPIDDDELFPDYDSTEVK